MLIGANQAGVVRFFTTPHTTHTRRDYTGFMELRELIKEHAAKLEKMLDVQFRVVYRHTDGFHSYAVRKLTSKGYKYTIHLDINMMRTARDAVFLLAHEARHIYQMVHHTEIHNASSEYYRIHAKYGNDLTYRTIPTERDADEFALMYEEAHGVLKNEVLNPDAPRSLLVHVKRLRSMIGL